MPLPEVTLVCEVVGVPVVLIQIPLSVTGDPPSAVTFPWTCAELVVIEVAGEVVVTVATTGLAEVVNDIWAP